MKFKIFSAAALAAFISLTPVVATTAYAGYSSIAAGDGGYGWVTGRGSMESARAAAKRACRNAGYGSCESAIAERDSWFFSGGVCDGRTYIGASPQGYWRSDEIVRAKAAADGYFGCTIEVNF